MSPTKPEVKSDLSKSIDQDIGKDRAKLAADGDGAVQVQDDPEKLKLFEAIQNVNIDVNDEHFLKMMKAVKMVTDAQFDSLKGKVQTVEFRMDNLEDTIQTYESRIEALELANVVTRTEHEKNLETAKIQFEKNLQTVIFSNLDKDVHDRKWQLILSGIPGQAGESKFMTRQKIQDLGFALFGQEYSPYLTACHRLKQTVNARIIVQFSDLDDRDFWLENASKLKNYNQHYNEKISFSVDLPPVLRRLKDDLLLKRKSLSVDNRILASLHYLQHWPYVSLRVKQHDTIHHKFGKHDIVKAVLDGEND